MIKQDQWVCIQILQNNFIKNYRKNSIKKYEKALHNDILDK